MDGRRPIIMLKEVIGDFDLDSGGEVAPFRIMNWDGFLYLSSAREI